jgi:hypothetical protein
LVGVGPQLSQPPQAALAALPLGASQRPRRCALGERRRSNASAKALKLRRQLVGNCFFHTTPALTSTASATMKYCNQRAMAQPAPIALAS